MASVTFTRASVPGATGDLVIPGIRGGTYWFSEVIEPDYDQRNTYAEDSPNVAGSLLTQSVTGLGSFGLTVWTKATDAATLRTQKRDLEAAVRQFSYTTTLDLDGGGDAYASGPAKISWGIAQYELSQHFMAFAVITIPVQPLGA